MFLHLLLRLTKNISQNQAQKDSGSTLSKEGQECWKMAGLIFFFMCFTEKEILIASDE